VTPAAWLQLASKHKTSGAALVSELDEWLSVRHRNDAINYHPFDDSDVYALVVTLRRAFGLS
jgi:hypothetical protein